MILSASRRTDIPNYYSEWLEERFRQMAVLFSVHSHRVWPRD